MNKKQLLQHLETEVYCRLKPSKYGVGIFAIKDIPKGTNPFMNTFEFSSIKFKKSELMHLPKLIQKMIFDFCCIEDDFVYVPRFGLNNMNIYFYLNHSMDPNLIDADDGNFIACREIKEGEELVVNYLTYNDSDKREYDELGK